MKSFFNSYFNIIKKFIPENKPKGSSVGLDIGGGDCKLVEIRKKGSDFELQSCIVETIEQGNVAGAIKNAISKTGSPVKSVYTAVTGKGSLIRFINMPRMSIEDLRSSFGIEADKYFPFSQDQIYTDCYILDPQAKDKQMHVMAAAAKRDLIEDRLRILTEMEMTTNFVGINVLALANVFNVLDFSKIIDPKKVTAVLDMGEMVTSLMLISNGLPRFTRDIYVGGRDFSKRISNALGMTFDEAEALKKKPGLRKDEILTACESVLLNIVQEVKLSFDYFMTENNVEIDKLVLTGGASKAEGMIEALGKNIGIAVGELDLLETIKIKEGLDDTVIQKNSHSLGVALGLALMQYD